MAARYGQPIGFETAFCQAKSTCNVILTKIRHLHSEEERIGMASKALASARSEIGQRIAEIQQRGPRLSPLDLHSRMDAIRQIAAANGLVAMEGLARHSAQLALLPGHRLALRCCLEHAEEALDSHAPGDCTAILAALALRLH